MKKSTKGAIAAAAAGVLLLGGAGTLAFWSDTVNLPGTDITSGHLTLVAAATDPCASAVWHLDSAAGPVFDAVNDTVIPGDSLVKNCNIAVDALGTHFTNVDLTVSGGTLTANALGAKFTKTLTVDGVTGSSVPNVAVTSGAVTTIPVAITLAWPYGSTVESPTAMDLTATLAAVSVVIKQDHLSDH